MKSRRRLFFVVAVVGLFVMVVAIAASLLGARKTEFVNEGLVATNRLFIPPLLEPRIENGEKVFDLTAQNGETEFFPGKPTKTSGYNGSYLGPTVRAHTGDNVRMNITNDLGETTTVHWHGMHLPAAMDGGPHQMITAGGTWQPYWTITNEASTLWYHPHEMGTTGEQVYSGLAGLFIIDDANSDSLDLPKEYGVDDVPLIIQDRQFDDKGQLIYQSHGQNAEVPLPAGMLGNTVLVNGTRAPYMEVTQKLVRLRVLNGSNGRRYNMGFSDNRAFYQIATDGGLLDAPAQMTRLLLAPGERAEIVVDLHDMQGPLTLLSYPIGGSGGILQSFTSGFFGQDDTNQQFTILELRPEAGATSAQEIPKKLNSIVRLRESSAVKTRQFILDAREINNKSMDDTRIDQIVKKGEVEIWEVRNESPFYHAFHVHDVQFLVLDHTFEGQRTDPPANEQGWKDTVVVNPSDTVRLIMQFNDYSDPNVPYMFHCHILEHEDMGMMGQFVVVDSLSDDVHVESTPMTMPGDSDMSH